MTAMTPVDVTYFRTPKAFAAWLRKHAGTRGELWVGFHKVGSGEPSLTWPQSVDEALCHGWIDGLRKGIDATRYCIRFTPRKAGSTWSKVNIARVEALVAEGRMQAAGLRAFAARSEGKSGIYSYEVRREALDEPFAGLLKKQRKAQANYDAQPAWYRRTVCNWVMGAKQEATRHSRFERLLAHCLAGTTVPAFTRQPAASARATPANPRPKKSAGKAAPAKPAKAAKKTGRPPGRATLA